MLIIYLEAMLVYLQEAVAEAVPCGGSLSEETRCHREMNGWGGWSPTVRWFQQNAGPYMYSSDVLSVIVIFNSGFRVTFFPLVSLLFDLHV